jgi:hypothetical protein
VCVCGCVCGGERERERERFMTERGIHLCLVALARGSEDTCPFVVGAAALFSYGVGSSYGLGFRV